MTTTVTHRREEALFKAIRKTAPDGILVKKMTIARGRIGYVVQTADSWLLAQIDNLVDLENYGFERYGKWFWKYYGGMDE